VWLRLRTSTMSWSVDSGRVMARHWQDACVDAVAKLPPLRARRFSETIRVELRAFLQSAMRRRVDSRPLTTGAGTDRDPKPEEFWSVPLSPCHGSRMARHQQEVRVDVVARWRPSEHRRFLALIPRGGRHVPSDWRRDDAVTGGPRATDRDAIPGEVSSGSEMMTAAARHRSEAPIYS